MFKRLHDRLRAKGSARMVEEARRSGFDDTVLPDGPHRGELVCMAPTDALSKALHRASARGDFHLYEK